MDTQTLKFSRPIKASPAEVYRYFTNRSALQEWFCDLATLDPKPGGRFYAAWHSGFYACGEYTRLAPDHEVAFTWHGRNEPGPTSVEVTLHAQDDKTLVELAHAGLGTGAEWAQMIIEASRGWISGLENLESILETGLDQRIVRRPMLGIALSDFNAEIAGQLDVPVSEGVRIDDVVENMGAQAAGLQKHDVIVSLAGHPLTDYASLSAALQGQRADEIVAVSFYRGPEKKTVDMKLSRRPLPEIPATALALAEFLRARSTEIQADLDEFFSTVSDAEAARKPGPDDWSIMEILAHLLQGERYWHFQIVEMIAGLEAQHDGWGGNLNLHVAATASVFPTLKEILVEYQRLREETIALLVRLPEEFVARKSSYWRLAYNVVNDTFHHRLHLDQMRAALATARSQP